MNTTGPTCRVPVSGDFTDSNRSRSVNQCRERDLQGAEHLSDAQGGNHQDQSRGGEEPAHHGGVDEEAGEQRGGQAEPQGGEVRDVEAGDGHGDDAGGQPADLGLGEVDDPGRPVDEDQAERGEGVERPDDDTEQDDPERGTVGQHGVGEHPAGDGGGDDARGERSSVHHGLAVGATRTTTRRTTTTISRAP